MNNKSTCIIALFQQIFALKYKEATENKYSFIDYSGFDFSVSYVGEFTKKELKLGFVEIEYSPFYESDYIIFLNKGLNQALVCSNEVVNQKKNICYRDEEVFYKIPINNIEFYQKNKGVWHEETEFNGTY